MEQGSSGFGAGAVGTDLEAQDELHVDNEFPVKNWCAVE